MASLQAILAALLGAVLVLAGDAVLADAPAPATPFLLRLPPRAIDSPRVVVERDESRKHAPTRASVATRRYGVSLWNVHTREVLPLPVDEAPTPDAVSEFLRCRVTGDTHTMAEAPLAVALELATRHEARLLHVISGFRSPKLNEMLRKKGHEVARNSRHTRGHALDFRVPGVGARVMAREAGELHAGGIGTYPVSGFIHVDIGPDRRWFGR